MGKGDDPNLHAGQPMPAAAPAGPTDRQLRKLNGLRTTHPGLIEYGLDDSGFFHFATPGKFRARRHPSQQGDYVDPVKQRISPDGRISKDRL